MFRREMIIKTNISTQTTLEIGRDIFSRQSFTNEFRIIDSSVAKAHKSLVTGNHFIVPSGEASKSLETYTEIVKALEKLSDVSSIVAIGGGVVGDLSGFVAATFKRGVPLIQVPTTLLSMVDASIGGKNGINLGNKKNYLGTVYQADKILIDLSFLETLPEKEFKNGLAEVIKYSYLFNRPSLIRMQSKVSPTDPDIEKIIIQCCQAKISAVEKDPLDKGYRHVLNFGHTIGHALELTCNLNHGEAVSIGMLKEAELAEEMGFISKSKLEGLKKALAANNMPVEIPNGFDIKEGLKLMAQDKKGKYVFAFSDQSYSVKLDEKKILQFLKYN
jgi:3-dehydroquinate synthase